MKRVVLLGLLLLAATTAAPADEIYVPSNTPSSGSRTLDPFGATSSRPDARYQLVIPASFLGGKPYVIRDISFAPSGAGAFAASAFEIRMSLVTTKISTIFAVNLPSPTSVLTSLKFSWSTKNLAWTRMRLTKTFTYDGTSGLTIDVRYRGGSYARPYTGSCMTGAGSAHKVYAIGKGSFNATTGTIGLNAAIKVRLSVVRAALFPSGTAKPGTTVRFDLLAGAEAGKAYQVGSSLGEGPIPIGTWKVPLSPDGLLVASTGGLLPTVFAAYTGKLDTSGKATANLRLPNVPALKGVRFYTAYLTLDPQGPSGVSQVSPNVVVTVQ